MATPASIAKHPIHPMLIPFPFALLVVTFLCDIAFFVTGNTTYGTVAFYCLAAGIVGALIAAVPGFVDYTALRSPKVRRIGTWHMILNLTAVVVFAVNLYVRTASGMEATGGSKTLPFVLSLIGVGLLSVSGWLGGEMVYVHGVGVEKDAPHAYDADREPLRKVG